MKKEKQTQLRTIDPPIKSEPRVPFNISLTVEDKLFLKMYALRNDTTVSALIASYVAVLRDEDKQ